jgi:hypothetical protein
VLRETTSKSRHSHPARGNPLLCLLFITTVPNTKVCAWGEEDSVCLFLQYLLQIVEDICGFQFITAGPIIKMCAGGAGDSGGHVLRETTSRGLCGLVCPSHTSERGERDIV